MGNETLLPALSAEPGAGALAGASAEREGGKQQAVAR